jgi:hypothetical protein
MTQIKAKAKELGIKPGKMRKAELIREIQKAEGNFECFGTADNSCDQMDCCWREDCIQ